MSLGRRDLLKALVAAPVAAPIAIQAALQLPSQSVFGRMVGVTGAGVRLQPGGALGFPNAARLGEMTPEYQAALSTWQADQRAHRAAELTEASEAHLHWVELEKIQGGLVQIADSPVPPQRAVGIVTAPSAGPWSFLLVDDVGSGP